MQNRKILAFGISFILILALIAGVWFFFLKPQATAGAKSVTLEVVMDETTASAVYTTPEGFLLGFLNGTSRVDATSGFITTVDERVADASLQEWWKISVNGDDAMVGAAEIPIQQDDVYTLTLMVGW